MTLNKSLDTLNKSLNILDVYVYISRNFKKPMPQQTLETSYNFFLETDLNRYKGEWVAISDSTIVAHGQDLKKVVEKAKSGGKKFLLAKVPSGETMIF